MLNLFRRRDLMIRILIAGILGLVCVMMVITLIPGFGGGTSERDSATILADIGNEQITVDQVERTLRLTSRNNPIPPSLYPVYARVILDQLVLSKLLQQEAKRLGVQVTDFEVADQLRQSPLFYPGGSFIGKERYQDLVDQRFGLTVSEFEQQIKSDMLSEKVRAIVTDGVVVTPAEVEREYKRRNEKIKIDYVAFSQAEEARSLNPTPAELQAFFQANHTRYQLPERRRAKYIFLDPHQMRAELKVTEEQLRQYYERNLDAYRIPERVHVSHILFKTVGKSDAEVEQIRQQALDALRRLKHGAKFDEMAKQYSEDASTKDRGGDLGWIARGQTVPEFEQTAFNLNKGAISDLVRTMYGFHIIRCLDKQTAHLQTLDEVKDKIEPILLQQEFEKVAQVRAARISDELLHGKSLEDVAREFNLTVRETNPFGVGEGFVPYGLHPEFNETAFRLNLNATSGPVHAAGGIMFLRLVEIQKPRQGELSEPEVETKVLRDYRAEKGVELARRKAQEFAERVRKGASFDEVAKAMALKVETKPPFARNSTMTDLGPLRPLYPAFAMPAGGIGGPLDQRSQFLVYRVVEHDPIDPAALARDRAFIERQLFDQKRTQTFELFSDGLRQAMIRSGKLKLHEQNLKRFAKAS